jgi:hypothetical protein
VLHSFDKNEMDSQAMIMVDQGSTNRMLDGSFNNEDDNMDKDKSELARRKSFNESLQKGRQAMG